MNEIGIAYCGLDCAQCPAYLATQKNDDRMRKATAKEWSMMYQATILPEQINCDGCTSGSDRLFQHCNQCQVRSCAIDLGYQNCGQCKDLPCDKLSPILKAVPEAEAALKKIAESM